VPKLLAELNPQWIGVNRTPDHGEGCAFDCPACGSGHTLAVYFKNPLDGGIPAHGGVAWTREGSSWDNLIITPSISYPCFHGWVEDGLVFNINESPITLPVKSDDGIKLIALSPKQARQLCTKVLAKVEELTRKPVAK
jgi:hypothetical protein